MVTVNFILGNNSPIVAGQMVHGRTIMHLEQPICANCIEIQVAGTSTVSWKSCGQAQVSVKNHLNRIYSCWKAGDNGRNATMPAGQYAFEFTFALPESSPPTFAVTNWSRDRSGKVEYECRLFIWGQRFAFVDKTFRHPFTVLSCGIPEHEILGFGLPYVIDRQFPVSKCYGWFCGCGCWCGQSETINTKVTISKAVFTPGEVCEVDLIVRNNSSLSIKSCKIQLIREVKCPTKSSSWTLQSKSIDQTAKESLICQPGTELKRHRSIVRIPLDIVPPFDAENLIVAYCIQIRLYYTGCCCSSLSTTVPITIATGGGPSMSTPPPSYEADLALRVMNMNPRLFPH